MKIINYLRSIGNLVGKGSVLEDLRLARTQFSDATEALKAADKSIGKFKSKEMLSVQNSYSTIMRSVGQKTLFGHIASNIANIQGTIDALEAVVAGEFDERIAAQGLDYRKANVLQLTDALVFASRFTIKLLSHALKHETAIAREDKKLSETDTTSVMVFEAEYITQGLNAYCRVMGVITANSTSNVERIAKIPEILATESNFNQLRGTVGDAVLDPFGFSATNFRYNPIRAIRMARVEAKAARAREAEVELQLAQLRMMQLERARQGKEDPGLEREIKYMQSLIDELSREITELTED